MKEPKKTTAKTISKMARQGDVLVMRTDAEPSGAKLPRENGAVVLAHGEVTGHSHAIHDPGVCSLRREGAAYDLLQVTEGGCTLKHEEHAPIAFGGGTYEVRIQQEWDYLAEMARSVVD